MTNITQADRDDMRGAEWMRSLAVAEHAAIPIALNPAGTRFRAMCRCRWEGPVWAVPFAKAHAQLDANAHNEEYA